VMFFVFPKRTRVGGAFAFEIHADLNVLPASLGRAVSSAQWKQLQSN
jgi:hypothetical protein